MKTKTEKGERKRKLNDEKDDRKDGHEKNVGVGKGEKRRKMEQERE